MGSIPTPAPRAKACIFKKEMICTDSSSAATAASLLTNAGTVITSALSMVWDVATSNPLLSLFVGVSILGVGFSVFRRARRTMK